MVPRGRGDNPHHCLGNLNVGDNGGSINSGREGNETSTMMQLLVVEAKICHAISKICHAIFNKNNDNDNAAVSAKMCHAVSKICHAIFDGNNNNNDAAVGA